MLTGVCSDFSFVDFGTIKEADAAIQKLHNFEMGSGVRLGVKVSEKKENREKRLTKKKEEEEFLGTLNCGRYTTDEEPSSCANGYELTSREMKQCERNPFLPSYRNQSPMADSPQEPSGTEDDERKEAEGFSLGDSAGALSLQASSMSSQTSPTCTDKSLPAVQTSPSSSKPGMCVKCKKQCTTKCSRCKTPYCSKKCQDSDWETHKLECKEKKYKALSNTPPDHAATPGEEIVIREKEHSEDEGFEIPTPPLSELMSVLHKPSPITEAVERLSVESSGVKPLPQTVDNSKREKSLDKESSIVVGNVAGNLPHTPPVTPPVTPSQSPGPTQSDTVVMSVPAATPSSHHHATRLSLTQVLDMFQASKFPLPSIPLGSSPQRFNAIVTGALSCVRFSAVLMSVESKQALKAIKNCGRSTYLAPIEPLCLVVGSKVGFLDSNSDLYRMEVTSMPPNLILRYYDFGGYRTSSHDTLVTLPEDIVTIPCLRYRCALDTLRAKDHDGVDYLMDIIGGNPVKITNHGRHQTVATQSVFYKCDAELLDGTHINPLVHEFLKTRPQEVTLKTPPRPPGVPSPHRPTGVHSPHRPTGIPLLHRPTRMPPASPLTPSGAPPDSSPAPPPGHLHPPSPQNRQQYKLMHMAKDVPPHIPPLDEEFVIIPKVVDSPYSIWAHVKHSMLSNLHRMHKDLNCEYTDSINKAHVYSPSVGELCVVRYCQDKQFYRAEVLCVNNNGTVDVRFVDFGNREMILVSQVQHIRPIYLTLPIQAVHFSLAGVVPCGQALSWNDSAVTYLKDKILNRELTARVVEQKANTFLISLSDPDSPGRSLADGMIALGCCERPSDKQLDSSLGRIKGVKMMQSPSSPLDAGAPTTTTQRLSQAEDTTATQDSTYSQPTLPQQSPSHETHFSQSSRRGFRPAPKSPPTSPPAPCEQRRGSVQSPRKVTQDSKSNAGPKAVQHISLTPTNHTVLVSSVTSPSVFHVQKFDKTALTSLCQLSQQLNGMVLDPFPNPQQNDFCVAKYAEDGALYRSRIYSRPGSKCSVKFIDYGNIEEVPVSDLYTLPPSFTSLPAQAILCTLKNFRPKGKREQGEKQPQPSPDSIQHFKRLVEDKLVDLKVHMVIDSNPLLYPKHIVDITMEDGKDVLSAMVQAGHSQSPPADGGSPNKQPGGRRGKSGEGGFRGGNSGEGGFGKGKSSGRSGGFKQKAQFRGKGSGQSATWDMEESTDSQQQSSSTEERSCATRASPVKRQDQNSTGSMGHRPPSPSANHYPPLSSLPTTQLPSDQEYIEVVVTDVSCPPLLSVQLASEQSLQSLSTLQAGLNSGNIQDILEHISTLQTDINSCNYSTHPSSTYRPQVCEVGHLCCCKYPVDNMWYRAAVIEVRGTERVVQFIDYGNKDTVPLSNIVTCPSEFHKDPVMAVQCSLNGVAPPPPSSQWSQQAISFLQQMCCDRVLLAKMVFRDEKSGVPHIELIDTSSDNDKYISAELISAGLAVASPPAEIPKEPTGAADHPPTSTTVTHSPGPTAAADHPTYTPVTHHPPTYTTVTHSPGPTAAADPPTYTPVTHHPPTYTPVTHLPGPILPNKEKFDVLVTSVASCTELYVHPVTPDTPHNMNTFMTSITEYCQAQTTPPSTPPSIGHYCLALFSDGNWFRAKVEAVNSRGIHVQFVDFGNRETVQLAQIRAMAAHFADLPIQVLRCGLCGTGPRHVVNPDPAVCQLLEEVATSSKMICRVVCYSPLLVDLTVPATGESVRNELVTAGKLPPPPHDAIFSVPTSSLTEGAKVNVLVTDVEGPGNFSVQSLESPHLAQLPPLMHSIMKYCCDPQHSARRPPVLGELCCAQFSEDSVWYRARVIGFSSISECHVSFLDYGNCEVCAVSAVLPATQEFLSLPALAISCCLVGWEDWEDWEGGGEGGSTQKFKSMTENQNLKATQKGTRRGRVMVELESLKDGPIHKQL